MEAVVEGELAHLERPLAVLLFMVAQAVEVITHLVHLMAWLLAVGVVAQVQGQHLAQALAANFASGGLCNESTRN
jgi:hypothetical protein